MLFPHVTQDDFTQEVLNAGQPVLVDFTATWCGPCKMLDPIVEELAVEWQDKVKVVKVDVDNNPDIPMQYQVMGVPTLMLFIDGTPQHRMSGYKPKPKVIKEFSKLLQ